MNWKETTASVMHMQIKAIRIYSVKIPFHNAIKHGLYSRHQTEAVIVVIEDGKGFKGFGEGTPRAYVTGESLESCLNAANSISKKIAGQKWESLDELNSWIFNHGITNIISENPAALCAVELACCDLWARYRSIPLNHLFKEKETYPPFVYSAVISYNSNEKKLLKILHLIQKLNIGKVKIKVIDHASGLSQLKRIREVLGEDVDLRIDANACFNSTEAINFIRLSKPFRFN